MVNFHMCMNRSEWSADADRKRPPDWHVKWQVWFKVAFQRLVLAGFSNRVHLSLLISFFALSRSLSPLAPSIHLQICHPSVVSLLISSSLGFLLCVRSLDYRFLSLSLAWWLNVAREHTHVLWCRRSLMWSDSSACVLNLCVRERGFNVLSALNNRTLLLFTDSSIYAASFQWWLKEYY